MNNNNGHIDYLDIVIKYLVNEANRDEIQLVEDWIDTDTANRKIFDEYKSILDSAGKATIGKYIDADIEWEVFKSKAGDEFSDTKVIKLNTEVKKPLVFRLSRVAAILLFTIISAAAIYFISDRLSYNKLMADAGVTEDKLPDGTLVTLNSNSSLKFPKKFEKNKRKVTLVGEAYFTVIPDKNKPFIVNAGKAVIQVLGTSFYVNATEDNDKIEVIVHTGKVEVSDNNGLSGKIILEAGDRGELSIKNGMLTKSANEDINYLSWKTRKMIFTDNTLSDIIYTINKVYNSNIIIGTDKIKDCSITVTFTGQTLDAVLNVLKATLNLEVKKDDSGIVLEGEGC